MDGLWTRASGNSYAREENYVFSVSTEKSVWNSLSPPVVGFNFSNFRFFFCLKMFILQKDLMWGLTFLGHIYLVWRRRNGHSSWRWKQLGQVSLRAWTTRPWSPKSNASARQPVKTIQTKSTKRETLILLIGSWSLIHVFFESIKRHRLTLPFFFPRVWMVSLFDFFFPKGRNERKRQRKNGVSHGKQ